MEQTPAIIIDDMDFGKLIELPKMYKEDLLSTNAATKAANALLPAIEVLDLTKADAAVMETSLAPVRVLRANLDKMEKIVNERRTPHTRKMDAIAALFIALEKRLANDRHRCKLLEDKWQIELQRRSDAAAAAAAKLLTEANEKVQKVADIKKEIYAKFAAALNETVLSMHTKFYAQTIPSIEGFTKALSAWTPVFVFDAAIQNLAGEIEHIVQARLDTEAQLKAEYLNRSISERDKLIDMKAGRIEQLRAGEVAQLVPIQEVTATGYIEAVEEESSKKMMDNSFEAAGSYAAAIPVSAGAKGAVKKRKYLVETHEGMKAIIQSWMTFNFGLLTVEELNTKLSFMRTAASERLNAGNPILEAKGLTVIDDISTRTIKHKQ